MKQRITLKVDPTTATMIKSLAKQRGKTMAAVVDSAMDTYHQETFCRPDDNLVPDSR